MIYPCFEYQLIDSGSVAEAFCNSEAMTPLMRWLLEGKIGETFVVVPSKQQIVILPTAKNRYIKKVIVAPIPESAEPTAATDNSDSNTDESSQG